MRLALVLICLAAAGPALAEGGPKPAQVKALAQAIAAAGCVVDDANKDQVLKAAGMTEQVAETAIDVLARDGAITPVATDVLRLTGREGCK